MNHKKISVALASLCIGALAGVPFAQAGGVGQIYAVVQTMFGGKQIRVSAPTNGQSLVYQSSTGSWINSTPSPPAADNLQAVLDAGRTASLSNTGTGAAMGLTAASITQGISGSVASFLGSTNQVVQVGMGVSGSGGIIGYGRSTDGAVAVVEGAATSLGSGESDFVSYGSGLRLCSDGNGVSSGEIGFWIAPSIATAFGNTRASTAKKWTIRDIATYPLQTQTSGVFGWTGSTDASAALTTTLSQQGAGVLQVGTTGANASGTVRAANFQLGSSYTTGDILYASDSSTLTKLAAGTSTHVLTSNGAGVAPSWQAAGGGASSTTFFYGDGSDGAQTFDGSSVVLGLTPSGNVYTLTRSIYLSSGTINSGVTIKLANYTLSCSGALTNNGTIQNNGNSAVTSTGGAAIAAGLFTATTAGTNGSTTASTAQAGAAGQQAGAGFMGGGGLSNGTQSADGAAPLLSAAMLTKLRHGAIFDASASTATVTNADFGQGTSGRGSGDGTNAGGGTGSRGGFCVVLAKTLTTGASAVYSSNGGDGGNGTAGTAGGGGGAGGGTVVLYAGTYSGTALVSGTNVTAAGGNGGTGSTTAGNGRNGGTGTVLILTAQ